MTQELIDLKLSILEGRYGDALAIVDELEWMSKKSILRNIKSYLIRLLVYLIKNQVEQRLTNSWAVSIRRSVVEIQDLNLRDDRGSYYIQIEEWDDYLNTAFETAVAEASLEIAKGEYKPVQLKKQVNSELIFNLAKQLLNSIYVSSDEDLERQINQQLSQLPGGKDWNLEE